jgi:hypothetical protein
MNYVLLEKPDFIREAQHHKPKELFTQVLKVYNHEGFEVGSRLFASFKADGEIYLYRSPIKSVKSDIRPTLQEEEAEITNLFISNPNKTVFRKGVLLLNLSDLHTP